MASYKKSLRLLSEHLQSDEKEELYLSDYYTKLRALDMDKKGQISTAYGQSGVGMTVGGAVDFGAMLGPGVHLVAGVNAKGSRTAHALLVLHRAPRKAWFKDIVKPLPDHKIQGGRGVRRRVPKHNWATDRYYALGFLRGHTKELGIDVSASAWVGFGAAFDVDETGVTAGAKIEAGGSGLFSRLCDPNPGLYAQYNSKLINGDLNGIFRENTKRKAAAWLIETGQGRKALKDADAPMETASSVARRLRVLGHNIEDLTLNAANTYDTHDTSISNRQFGNWLSSALSIGWNRGKGAYNTVTGKTLKTNKLITEIAASLAQFIALRDKALEEDVYLKRLRAIAAEVAQVHLVSYAVKIKHNARLIEACKLRILEAEVQLVNLKRAQELKFFNKVADNRQAAAAPQFFLDVVMVEGHVSGEVGAQFVLPTILGREKKRALGEEKKNLEGVKKYVPTLHATVAAEGYTKRIGSRFQSYVLGSGGHNRTLLSTQDAVVKYNSRLIKGSSGVTTQRTVSGETQFNLITMTYRAVLANWFDDTFAHAHEALPCGSGISFGMSILQTRIQAYAAACLTMSDRDILIDSESPDDIHPFEFAMRRQLRVPRRDLRLCFRQIPKNLLAEDRPDEAFVIESSFAFVQPQKLSIDKHKTKNLFDLPAFKKLGSDGASQDFDNTRLQVIRIRYRVKTDEDRTRNYFSLGWNPMVYLHKNDDGSNKEEESIVPFVDQNNYGEDLKNFDQFKTVADDFAVKKKWQEHIDEVKDNGIEFPELQVQVSTGLERVERVGSETILTLYEHLVEPFYSPKDYTPERIKELKEQNDERDAEMLVPPVMLFSQ